MTFTGTVDYSLYLVTGRDLLPSGADYYETLEESLKGGVTLVQVREKEADTREFLEIAKRTKEICNKYNVPVLINDRIDIALAMEADGVHVGQSDMPASLVRKLMPQGLILGVSANTPAEAAKAVEDGADYIGIGPIWNTSTKKDIKNVLGVRGVGQILDALEGSDVKAVGIAGINERNVLRTLHGSVSIRNRSLNGVAVVSALMASKKPYEAAKALSAVVKGFLSTPPLLSRLDTSSLHTEGIVNAVAHLLSEVREGSPVIHQITNNVAINQSANITLALGASPIMATAPQEMEDLSKISGALLVNFGTITDKDGMLEAGKWVNARKNPIVFDPVAVGATKFRYETAQELLNTWQASVIKGNPAEIGTLANSDEVKSRGVDSAGSGFANPAPMLRELARKERCVIAMTGKTDWVSDGSVTISSSNGHEYLSQITGSGCIVGSSVATFCAAANLSAKSGTTDDHLPHPRLVYGDMLIGVIGGMLAITIASELAAERQDVLGTGTFLPALVDELYHLTPEKILKRARIEIHT
ncbi:hypothetical protein ACEPAG_8025 [Sanghuangporus baumii]